MKLLPCLLLVFPVLSCSLTDPDEKDPAFLEVSSYSFNVTGSQETASQAISELWFYDSGDILAVLDTPCSVPVLKNGSTSLQVYAGIMNNGISTERIRYPFYAPFDTTISLLPNGMHFFNPKFRYVDNLLFDISRNFEGGNYFTAGQGNEGTFQVIEDNELVYEGSKSGKASLTTGSYLHFYDDNPFQLESGNTIFLEMNYSCNNSFAIGLYSNTGGDISKNHLLFLLPTGTGTAPTWQKIYIDLGLVAQDHPNASEHRIYIESTANQSDQPVIYLDNLKIVRFEP